MVEVNRGYCPSLSDMVILRAAVEQEAVTDAVVERAGGPRPPKYYEQPQRTGYQDNHLAFDVPLPTPQGSTADDVLETNFPSGRLDYMHFSVVMSKSRKVALFTAVNIEGARSVQIPRAGGDVWYYDHRIPRESQTGGELYAGNRLDRGHLVRREDPNWGDEADIANEDTFHFTNCAPQMDAFNQRTWLGLETYILRNARAWKERCSVFTGPVFRPGDQLYRGVRIPRAFWKVVAFVSDDGRPSATAYLIDQERELGMLEAAFGEYKTFQKSVISIEEISGISFGQLSQYDGFSNAERHTKTTIEAKIESLGDVRV